MKLIHAVRIRGFRSIADQGLPDFGSFTALVGRNSSGKSNVLRALNLFFNGEVEPHKPLAFARDFHARVPKTKRKKEILISVDFEVPAQFKYRKEFDQLRRIGPTFRIEQRWTLDQRRNVSRTITAWSDGKLVLNGGALAEQFLSLIVYRYIPNRSIPSELLKSESQSVADAIFMRMKGDKSASELLDSLTAAASRMLSAASGSMEASGSPLTSPSVTTPASIGQMLRMSGFQATGQHGGTVQDEDWGAGHQAFFLYSVLHALDTNYGRFFGWRQATVWGVEEPEAALHRDLETKLADTLRSWALDGTSRLQVLHTTHSPIMTMASDFGYCVELMQGESMLSVKDIPELTRFAEMKGVSGWVHPVLSFPWNPVVLCEGPLDADVLAHVAALIGFGHLRFLAPPQLDPLDRGGGKDAVINFLRRSQRLIANRPKEAPLLVWLDWDVSDMELRQARAAYGAGADFKVSRMDARYCESDLGPDFKGIERLYPAAVILDAHDAGEVVLGISKGKPVSISADQLKSAKGHFLQRLKSVSDPKALAALVAVVCGIERAARGAGPEQLPLTVAVSSP